MSVGRDARCVALTRTPKYKLIIMCRTGVRRPDGGLIRIEGAYPLEEWTKDDLISSILSVEYPAGGDPVSEPFAEGQEVIWTGLAHLFARRVRIVAARRGLRRIGQQSEEAPIFYDIADPTIKGTVYAIPGDQLEAVPEPIGAEQEWSATEAGAAVVAALDQLEATPESTGRIVRITLAEAHTDPASVPEGTTASRCTACGEVRLSYPGDFTDEWKRHFDYCADDANREQCPRCGNGTFAIFYDPVAQARHVECADCHEVFGGIR